MTNLSEWVKSFNHPFREELDTQFHLAPLFDYSKVRIKQEFIQLAAEFWDPSRHVFRFNNSEMCPTMEEFGAILGRSDFNHVLLPSTAQAKAEDLVPIFGISLRIAHDWFSNSQIDMQSVISHFHPSPAATVKNQTQYQLNAACLCILAEYLFTDVPGFMDATLLRFLPVLRVQNPCMMILAGTLNALSKFVRGEVPFVGGSPLLLQVSIFYDFVNIAMRMQ